MVSKRESSQQVHLEVGGQPCGAWRKLCDEAECRKLLQDQAGPEEGSPVRKAKVKSAGLH